MHVHLAFVKLEADPPTREDLGRLRASLRAVLADWSADVMGPSDPDAAQAWDVAIQVRGEAAGLEAMKQALAEALTAWPVAVHKGWSFVEETS